MSKGNFSQFVAGERQYNDTESVQAPVVDKSGLVKAQGLTQGVSAFTNTALGVYSEVDDVKKKSALMEQQDMFQKSLLKAAQLADAHGANSLMFRTYLTQEYANSGLDFDTKTKMMKDFQATVLGKPFLEEDPVAEAEKDLDQAATKAGFLKSNMNDEQKLVGRIQYRAMLSKQEADAEELRLLQLQKSKVDLTAAQINLVDKQIKDKSYQSMANLAANYRPVIKNDVVEVVGRFNKGEITRQDAEAMLKAKKGDIAAVVGQLSRNLSQSDVELLAKPMYDLYDVALKNLDSATVLEDIQTSIGIMEAETQRNMLINNPELVRAVSLSSLTKHNDPATIATIGNLSAKILQTNGDANTDSPANVADGEKASADYLNLVTNGISNLGRMSPIGEPMVDTVELNTQVDNILKGTARFMSDMDRPAKIKTLVKWLADPKVGSYVKENLKSLSAEARLNITDTLVQNAKNYLYPKVSEMVSSQFMQGGKREVKYDDVDISLSSGQVVFRATNRDSWTMSVAQSMNKEVGAAMSSYFNAIANVSGESVEEVFNRELSTFWPEKAPTSTEGKSVKQAPTQDLSQYEGKVGYKDGVAYTVINGILTKIGGGANAGSK